MKQFSVLNHFQGFKLAEDSIKFMLIHENFDNPMGLYTSVYSIIKINCVQQHHDVQVESYKCSDLGLILPLVDESGWSDTTRAILYFIALIYSFFGMSIAADVFMCAIEKITSQTRTIKEKHPEFGSVDDLEGTAKTSFHHARVREVRIWNPTVANLTLMALGSSAPEILLSAIEVFGRNFKAGALGPSTIVGSAAFNLLMITAVCISSVSSESKRISEILVFAITSSFSVLAYVWLLIILKFISPDIIETWEAVITLLLFVVLILGAYAADKKICMKWVIGKKRINIMTPAEEYTDQDEKKVANGFKEEVKEELPMEPIDGQTELTHVANQGGRVETPASAKHRAATAAKSRPVTTQGIFIKPAISRGATRESNRSTTPSSTLQIERNLAKQYPHASAEMLAHMTAQNIQKNSPHSHLYYRLAVSKWLAAHLQSQEPKRPQTASDVNQQRPVSAISNLSIRSQLAVDPIKLSVIQFAAHKYAVCESDGNIRLKVIRESHRTNKRVLFKYETLDGSAKRGKDYVSQSETLVFNPMETEKLINIQILKSGEREPDEMFYVKLEVEDFADGRTLIGPNNVALVTIVDKDDKDTKIQFSQTSMVVKENQGTVQIPVLRRGNTKIQTSIEWKTVDGSAINGADFIGGTGRIHFDTGEIEKRIEIQIMDDKEIEKHESFEVMLSNPGEGATLSSKKKKCIVTILNDDETTLLLTQSEKLIPKKLEAMQPGAQSWREQFIDAANVNGGDINGATQLDYILHIMTFGWKLIFAFVPPPVIGGGWLTFVVGLVMLGILTAIVGDLATIFGCLVGLRPSVVAITFVAMGTSLPDLFASRLAATNEKTADNSIGNVTGSNSVNVFLGLGIAWFSAAVYWSQRDGYFRVPAGDLAFSVMIYTIAAVLCIGLLMVRRNTSVFGKGELGGPRIAKWFSSSILVMLWIIYIMLSALQAYEYIPGF